MHPIHDHVVDSILDALEAFDLRTAPFGLYACEEYQAQGDQPHPRFRQEWKLCLKPCLAGLGCRPASKLWVPRGPIPGDPGGHAGLFSFDLPDGGGLAEATLVRTAKIKVRKFGSAYRLDRQVKFRERWQALRLNQHLNGLWKPRRWSARDAALQIVLFLGFAAERDPFREELAELEAQVRWDRHDVRFRSRTWPDPHDRFFSLKLAAWSRSAPGCEPSPPPA